MSHPGLTNTVPSSEVPSGFTTYNANMHKYVVMYWDKLAMAAGPTLSNATITHLMLGATDFGGHAWARNLPYAIKRPLESRVWYEYPGMNAGHGLGNTPWPIKTARVLEGGASQVTEMTYNAKGMVTSRIDPLGRQTNYTYATNGLDLLQVEQVRSGGTDIIQQYSNYNAQHLPGTITDAAGQDTDITYNSAGQPLTVTNAKSETTTYTYETGTNNLLTVTGPVTGATTTNTYDAYGRLESVEDADGYVVITDYDHLNRVTQRTYPDDTTETNTYTRLDLTEQKDRLGRVTRHFYDGFGRRIATRDPAGRTISQVWCDCGAMEALVDANGNRTRWERDVQGRITREVLTDNTTDTNFTYDLTGRLKTIIDPKDQVTTHSYNIDDSLSATAYTNETIATPDLSYSYDSYYARVVTVIDGIGTTSYAYKAPGTNGAGQLASIDGPVSNDTIAYTYDELGRVVERSINGTANTVTWTFDALGRVTSEENLLGEFLYSYDGISPRLATVTYPNDQTSTYSYLDDEGDHRVLTIHHKYPSAATLGKFDYTYDAVGNILTWRQQADSTAVLWRYGYDAVNQLVSAVKHATDTPETVLQRFAYAYDSAGNRTVEQIDDATTLSVYDNLNRLTSQTPGGPMVIAGSLNEAGTVTISGVPAAVDLQNNFRGSVPMATGTNTITIVAKDISGNTTTAQYEVDVTGPSRSFSYDANGSMTSDGQRSFSWNGANQLVRVVDGNTQSDLAYDAARRLTQFEYRESGVLNQAGSYVWSLTTPAEKRNATAGSITRLEPLGEATAAGNVFTTLDHLGSARDLTNTSGVRQARRDFDPFGWMTISSGSSGLSTGFTGLLSAVSNLDTALYRSYDSSIGRWLRLDPIGPADNVNMYAYVASRPLSYIDPSGLASCRPMRSLWKSAAKWIGTVRRPLTNWAYAGSDSIGDLGELIPIGSLLCHWARMMDVTRTYQRINLSLFMCTEQTTSETCGEQTNALGKFWYQIRPFIEEFTESESYLERGATKFTAPSGMLGDMSLLACINHGPPRR